MAKRFSLVFDGQTYEVDQPTLSGIQIRALCAVRPDWGLVVEGRGEAPDHILQDDQVLDLSTGPARVFGHPPTSFGNRC